MRKARESQILELLSQCGRMEVAALAQRLGVSQVTVRKDLDALGGRAFSPGNTALPCRAAGTT